MFWQGKNGHCLVIFLPRDGILSCLAKQNVILQDEARGTVWPLEGRLREVNITQHAFQC